MSIRNLTFAVMCLIGLLTMGPVANAGGLDDPQEPVQDTSDAEDEIADQPAEVSGAF